MASVRRLSSVAVVLGYFWLALVGLIPSAFVGGPATTNRPATAPRRIGNIATQAEAGEGMVVLSSGPSLEISPLLRVASGITGLIRPLLNAQAKMQAGDYDQDEIRALIESESKSAPVVMYTLSQSPFSIDAKRLLQEANVDFKEIELAPLFILAEGENAARRAELGEMTGRTSLPHIFIGGESIGGLYDGTPGLVSLIESGELQTRVQNAQPGPFDFLMGMFR